MSDELWMPVAGYEGKYIVSNRGRAMRDKTIATSMDVPKDCPLDPDARMWSTLDGVEWCHGDVVESDACKNCPLFIDHVMRMREAVWETYLSGRRRA